jgi:ApbE superfamily uncharacterized protein (UPF0280 family)
MPRAQIRLLPDGRRLHLNDGPIDLIVEAFESQTERRFFPSDAPGVSSLGHNHVGTAAPGCPAEGSSARNQTNSGAIREAYRSAAARFMTVLDELCAELPLLRREPNPDNWPTGVIARCMANAVAPYSAGTFITPMAAVAGAVAEEILNAMTATALLDKAYVNNGGDIAIHLAPDQNFVVGMVERPDRPSLFSTVTLTADQPIRGIATSGWRGRSFSLGIADAVTVLADTASMADAAATIIANAVDLPGHPSIVRVRACDLAPDNDLGERLVTQGVGELTDREIADALSAGVDRARSLLTGGLIRAAALHLQGQTRVVGDTVPLAQAPNLDVERGLLHA